MSEREVELERMCNRLAASVLLLAHDAHPTYANTTGWRGGIGGAAITQGCSIVDMPPGDWWTQMDMPTAVAREWIMSNPFDFESVKAELREEWNAEIAPATTPTRPEEGEK